MSQIDLLSTEEQDVLLWVAEMQVGLLDSDSVTLADQSAFAWVSAIIDQLVRRGFLHREFIKPAAAGVSLSGLCAHLTDQGAEAVVELWRRRLGQPWHPAVQSPSANIA